MTCNVHHSHMCPIKESEQMTHSHVSDVIASELFKKQENRKKMKNIAHINMPREKER